MAESPEMMREVATEMQALAAKHKFDYVFKASFDKANRSSIHSERGPGWQTAATWFADLKSEFGLPMLTDVHETSQVKEVASVCDVLQIPAFLCRQTDLLLAAVETGKAVNVKKGQFLAPSACKQIIDKITAASQEQGLQPNFAITERGYTFGYGNLVVDMRAFKMISDLGAPTVFDVTHSLQLPAQGEVTGGLRSMAPTLARAAAATGYVDGFFVEVHPNPARAKSDGATQLSIPQATALLPQLVDLWHQGREQQAIDKLFV